MSPTKGADSAAAETVSGTEKPRGWRDHIPVHPAADLFPLMSESELRELGEDIKANGLRSSIVLYKGKLLDGRNRLDAMELVGIKFEIDDGVLGTFLRSDERALTVLTGDRVYFDDFGGVDPYNFVLSANIHRRHLTSDQKRELIAKILKAKPGESNRQIAKQVKADDKTVASVRRDLESVAEIPHLEKTVGADGKQYKSRQTKATEVARDRAEIVALAQAAKAAEAELDGFLMRLDIVERALLLVSTMDDQQRAKFFVKYCELYET